jgi:predicted amidohydrolase YtcJ
LYTPAFILHLYDWALLNGVALCAVGITKDTPQPDDQLFQVARSDEEVSDFG